MLEDAAAVATSCLEEDDPWRGVERFLYEMAERASEDHGITDATKERCMASPALAAERGPDPRPHRPAGPPRPERPASSATTSPART